MKKKLSVGAAILMAILAAACSQDPAAAYAVSYDGNGATSGSVPTDSGSYAAGATVTVLGNAGGLAKTYNAFAGWNSAADGSGTGYSPGATFTMGGASVTLYAQWTSSVGTGGISASSPSAVTVALTLGSSIVSAGNPITATAAASDSIDSYAWYLDGSEVSGQSGASFSGGASLAAGPHTLMVVVRKDGIAYSASALVSVAN